MHHYRIRRRYTLDEAARICERAGLGLDWCTFGRPDGTSGWSKMMWHLHPYTASPWVVSTWREAVGMAVDTLRERARFRARRRAARAGAQSTS